MAQYRDPCSGYPSNLALLADFDQLDIHPDVVITGGELLTDEIRKKLTDKFRPTLLNAVYASALMLICLMQMNKVVQFLYFQF